MFSSLKKRSDMMASGYSIQRNNSPKSDYILQRKKEIIHCNLAMNK